jgi:hypothetical protein
MEITKKFVRFATIVSTFLLINANAWGQEQVLGEVGAAVAYPSGQQAVVRPDFSDKVAGDYTEWVAASGRSVIASTITLKGSLLLMEETDAPGTFSTWIREYNSAGTEITDQGFPVDCFAIEYSFTRNNGRPDTDTFSECNTFESLSDGTIRIAGAFRGGFVIGSYDPKNQNGGPVGEIVAEGTPPDIIDLDADEFRDADTRHGKGYWAMGDRKKIIFFPIGDEANLRGCCDA